MIRKFLFSKKVGQFILLGSSATISISIIASLFGYAAKMFIVIGLVIMVGYMFAGIKNELCEIAHHDIRNEK